MAITDVKLIAQLSEVTQIFNALDSDKDGFVDKLDLIIFLDNMGLLVSDPRVKQVYERIREGVWESTRLDLKTFGSLVQEHIGILSRAIKGDMVIPDFQGFSKHIKDIYEKTLSLKTGNVATYIPELEKVSPEKYAISICTVDGQQLSFGDSKDFFSIQSISKFINYCLALEASGEDYVHKYVGREPSGLSFNEITLDALKRPHNPLINAGAIMTASMVKPDLPSSSRLDYVLDVWAQTCGGVKSNFNKTLYLSEKKTGDRNFALGYFMKESNSFPKNTDLLETLDFYFRCCAVEMNTEMMAVTAATLAASGVNPLTNQKVFKPWVVKNCLSAMFSCGMYDFSGEFAFTVGLPAKSGVGGGLMIVVPNLMGICIWSPRLDKNGNSVRGIEFCRKLVNKFNFHVHDNLINTDGKKLDPRKRKNLSKVDGVMSLCWAASQGDLDEVISLVALGVKIDEGDYDKRTPLHLAASEGQLNIVEYLISKKCNISPKDRWGHTPLDNSVEGKYSEISALLSNTKIN